MPLVEYLTMHALSLFSFRKIIHENKSYDKSFLENPMHELIKPEKL